MDSNKNKATRAKEVAENMFNARDIVGALKFALKARSLFPSLEDIVEMIETFNVHVSAMNKINGETDWYGVLKVDPMADDDTLRKQYSELSLMLHPDKNKSIGACGAFNLVSQAWSVLSDKAKRVAYDEKINAVVCSLSTECVDPPEPMEASFGYKITLTATTPGTNNQENIDAEDASETAQSSRSEDSFWTVCNQCKSCYQYFRAFVNRRLVCHVCHKPFFAVETDRPGKGIYRFVTPRKILKIRRDVSEKSLADSNFNWCPLPRTFDASSTDQAVNAAQNFLANRKFLWSPLLRTSGGSSAARAVNMVMVQKITDKLKRRRDEEEHKCEDASLGDLHVSKKGYFSPAKVSKALEDLSLSSHNGEACENLQASNTGKSNHSDLEYWGISGVDKNFTAIGSFQAELLNHRLEMDIEEISQKLEELKHDTDDDQKVNEAGEEEYLTSAVTCDQSNNGKLEDRMSRSQATKPFAGTTTADIVAENLGKMSIDVSQNDDKKDANYAEELINDIGILGEEMKGNDKWCVF